MQTLYFFQVQIYLTRELWSFWYMSCKPSSLFFFLINALDSGNIRAELADSATCNLHVQKSYLVSSSLLRRTFTLLSVIIVRHHEADNRLDSYGEVRAP